MDYEDKFRKYLKEKGLKFTPERRMILKEIFSIHEHFEADELLVRFRTRGENISRASIFRTLKLSVESQLTRKILIGENRSYYEHVFGHEHHEHLVCLGCGKIIEFSNLKIEKLQNMVCREYGFKPVDHTLKISGYCKECQGDSNAGRKRSKVGSN